LETVVKEQWGMENEPESPPPKTPLRWYQYRLRTLLIIMTVFAAWMAWVSHRAQQQKIAVQMIRTLGGDIIYDYQKRKDKNIGDIDPEALPPGSVWLRNFIGEDYFQSVVQVSLTKTSVTDDDLAVLEKLPDLEILDLTETKITSKGLAHLEGMRRLKSLFLFKTFVDDGGLAHLENLTDLRVLSLECTKITDAGTVHLQKMTNLKEWFSLGYTPITNDSLKYFKNLKKLKELMLLGTKVTEQGVKDLKMTLPDTSIYYSQNGKDRVL
jgi:hypothetical protein